jgi:tripartite-type tricarboxylate transporter receptor subunit TctC
VPGYDYSGWAGLLAPKATPKAIIDRLQAALVTAAANPALKDGFAAQGAEVVVTSPEEFRRFLEQDIASTARVVKAAGLQPE